MFAGVSGMGARMRSAMVLSLFAQNGQQRQSQVADFFECACDVADRRAGDGEARRELRKDELAAEKWIGHFGRAGIVETRGFAFAIEQRVCTRREFEYLERRERADGRLAER